MFACFPRSVDGSGGKYFLRLNQKMAVAPPLLVSDLPLLGIVKVRKRILKASNLDKGPKILQNSENRLKSPKKSSINKNSQPTNDNKASIITENVPIKVKISKPRSKKGQKIPIMEQIDPKSSIIEPILATTTATSGIKDTIMVDNSLAETILEPEKVEDPENSLKSPPKRRGRPVGSLDRVKRQAREGQQLGRPFGSKDARPRKRRSARVSNVM